MGAIDEALDASTQTPDQLRERAEVLRLEAAAAEFRGVRDAKLAFADRLEAQAGLRVTFVGARQS